MGLGLHGGAFQVVKWLLKRGAQLTITDLKTAKQLEPTLKKIKALAGSNKIKYTLGRHSLADFVKQDLIVQNPGVPANSLYLKQARENKIPIVNEAVMFFGLFRGSSVGVTGTRGKSTTATLIHHILKTAIKGNVLAGNIATTPMFSVLDKLQTNSWPVLELSSWHLENLGEYKISPAVAVITNIMSDHLNRYGSMQAYAEAKYHIVRNQGKEDYAVLNWDNKLSSQAAKLTKAKVFYFSLLKKVKGIYYQSGEIYFYDGKRQERVMDIKKIKLLGEHNLANILAAICVAKLLKVNNLNIAKAINSFTGVDFRLQFIGKLGKALVYNDSTSTTPDATMAAIKALAGKKIVLLAGGQDKNLDYGALAKVIKEQVKNVVLLKGTGSDKLIAALHKVKYPLKHLAKGFSSLKAAYTLAKKNLVKADLLLFSPAAASFNMFVNEFDRARKFNQLVKNDQKKKKL